LGGAPKHCGDAESKNRNPIELNNSRFTNWWGCN